MLRINKKNTNGLFARIMGKISILTALIIDR